MASPIRHAFHPSSRGRWCSPASCPAEANDRASALEPLFGVVLSLGTLAVPRDSASCDDDSASGNRIGGESFLFVFSVRDVAVTYTMAQNLVPCFSGGTPQVLACGKLGFLGVYEVRKIQSS